MRLIRLKGDFLIERNINGIRFRFVGRSAFEVFPLNATWRILLLRSKVRVSLSQVPTEFPLDLGKAQYPVGCLSASKPNVVYTED